MIYYSIELILNLTLLVALTVISGFVRKRWGGNTLLGQLLQGFLFGSAGVIGMLHPLHFSPGVIFDGRSVMISLCALFFGPWSAAIASAMTILVRIGLGGSGMFMGVLVILSSAGIGLLVRFRFNPEFKIPPVWMFYLFGLVVHLAMLALMFTLPEGVGLLVVKNIGLPILLLYPLATILTGKILSDQLETERTMAMLRASRTRLIEAQHIAKTGDFNWDVNTGEVTWSDGLLDLLKYDKSEKIDYAKINAEICHPEDLERVTAWLNNCIASGSKELTPNEYRLIRKDGEIIFVNTVGVIQRKQGKNPVVFATVQDISDRKMADAERGMLADQLRQSQKMEAVGTMAGGIAHDFNNILTIIIGNAEMIFDEIPADNKAREYIKEITKASARAKDLVSQILAFSRKEQKELISLRPQSMIQETLKSLRSITPTTVSIVQNISQGCGKIKADPTGLHQILMNFFTNAVHSMDEKGEVTVSLQEVNLGSDELDQLPAMTRFFSIKTPGTYARLSVTDNGTGMDEKTVERIFDPFYTTKEVGKGTGMGLSVVHGIVESHGGFIDVDSEPGQGSTFHVFFPITEEEEPVELEKAHSQTGTERILFIDDEESLLALGKRILDKLGYEVTAEINSVKALEIFKDYPHQFDLIITDQAMPSMSGLELVVEILKVRPDMPVILCTGYSSKISKENAKEKDISGFITKPYTKKILAETVRKVLNGKV